jgi:YD repeat-containing protein
MRMVQGWIVTFIALLVTLPLPLLADIQYVYDDAGRLVQVVAQDGSSAQYVYDAAGNISAIKRFTANQLALSAFTPGVAAVGAQVTLHGSGFSATAGSNAVTLQWRDGQCHQRGAQ